MQKVKKYVNMVYPNNKYRREGILYYAKLIIFQSPKAYLAEEVKDLTTLVKESSVDSITSILQNSQKLGDYARNTFRENQKFKQLGLSSFSSKNLSIDMVSKKLPSLPVEELFALNSYWINHYAKQLSKYGNAIHSIYALNKFMEIPSIELPKEFKGYDDLISYSNISELSQKEEILTAVDRAIDKQFLNKISNKDLETILLKYSTLYYPAFRFNAQRNKRISEKKDLENIKGLEEHEGVFYTFSYDPLVNQTHNLYGPQFNEYFTSLMPEHPTNLRDELNFLAPLYNANYIAYLQKDEILRLSILQLDKFKNAGYVVEKKKNSAPSFLRSKSLIAFDISATAPLFEHIDTQKLIEILKCYTGDTKIQIYFGHEDFRAVNGDIYPSNLAIPFSEKQKDTLKDSLKKNLIKPFALDTVEHTYFLANSSKLPASLKDKSSKKSKLRKPIYYDLSTGEFYQKDKDGNYVLDADFQISNKKKVGTNLDDR